MPKISTNDVIIPEWRHIFQNNFDRYVELFSLHIFAKFHKNRTKDKNFARGGGESAPLQFQDKNSPAGIGLKCLKRGVGRKGSMWCIRSTYSMSHVSPTLSHVSPLWGDLRQINFGFWMAISWVLTMISQSFNFLWKHYSTVYFWYKNISKIC